MKVDIYDLLGLAGIVMIGAGIGLISIPLMLVVCGTILLLIGLLGAWIKGRK